MLGGWIYHLAPDVCRRRIVIEGEGEPREMTLGDAIGEHVDTPLSALACCVGELLSIGEGSLSGGLVPPETWRWA